MSSLEFLIPERFTPTDIFRFGVITSTRPLRVKLDGDTAQTEVTPIIVTDTGGIGSRVLLQIKNRQLMIVGRVGGSLQILGPTADLNDYEDTGSFHQPLTVNAASGSNYPIASAGMLDVVRGDEGFQIFQTYTQYSNGTVLRRTRYNGDWFDWQVLSNSTPWTNVTGWDGTVELYNPSTPIRVGRVNGSIYLNGAMRVLSGTSGTIGTLPSWAIPDDITVKVWRCQGSLNNAWGLEISSSGVMSWGRYGPATPGADTWLPFNVSWPEAGFL